MWSNVAFVCFGCLFGCAIAVLTVSDFSESMKVIFRCLLFIVILLVGAMLYAIGG